MSALSALYPIRVVHTRSGVRGFAIQSFNEHSNTWQFQGAVRTGPRAWQEIHLDKMQLLADLERERAEAESLAEGVTPC